MEDIDRDMDRDNDKDSVGSWEVAAAYKNMGVIASMESNCKESYNLHRSIRAPEVQVVEVRA